MINEKIISNLLERGVYINGKGYAPNPITIKSMGKGLVFEFKGAIFTINENTDLSTIKALEEAIGFSLINESNEQVIIRSFIQQLEQINPFDKVYFDTWNYIITFYNDPIAPKYKLKKIPDELIKYLDYYSKDLEMLYDEQKEYLSELIRAKDTLTSENKAELKLYYWRLQQHNALLRDLKGDFISPYREFLLKIEEMLEEILENEI